MSVVGVLGRVFSDQCPLFGVVDRAMASGHRRVGGVKVGGLQFDETRLVVSFRVQHRVPL